MASPNESKHQTRALSLNDNMLNRSPIVPPTVTQTPLSMVAADAQAQWSFSKDGGTGAMLVKTEVEASGGAAIKVEPLARANQVVQSARLMEVFFQNAQGDAPFNVPRVTQYGTGNEDALAELKTRLGKLSEGDPNGRQDKIAQQLASLDKVAAGNAAVIKMEFASGQPFNRLASEDKASLLKTDQLGQTLGRATAVAIALQMNDHLGLNSDGLEAATNPTNMTFDPATGQLSLIDFESKITILGESEAGAPLTLLGRDHVDQMMGKLYDYQAEALSSPEAFEKAIDDIASGLHTPFTNTIRAFTVASDTSSFLLKADESIAANELTDEDRRRFAANLLTGSVDGLDYVKQNITALRMAAATTNETMMVVEAPGQPPQEMHVQHFYTEETLNALNQRLQNMDLQDLRQKAALRMTEVEQSRKQQVQNQLRALDTEVGRVLEDIRDLDKRIGKLQAGTEGVQDKLKAAYRGRNDMLTELQERKLTKKGRLDEIRQEMVSLQNTESFNDAMKKQVIAARERAALNQQAGLSPAPKWVNKPRFEPQDTLSGQDFAFRENKDMSTAQANETFMVDARFNRSLGKNGEALGFAKKQFSDDPQLVQARQKEADRLQAIYMELAERPEVKKWLNDRRKVANIDQELSIAKNNLQGAEERLEVARTASPPDELDIKSKKDGVDSLSKQVDELNRISANREREKELLVQFRNLTPSIQQYQKTKQQYAIAVNLVTSIDGVAESTAELYLDHKLMGSPQQGGDRQLLTRAVASHKVDQLLDLNICAEEKFGVDEKGVLYGISIQCDGAGVRSSHGFDDYGEPTTAFLNIDYSDPRIQRGVHDLEALDYLTGQVDRHAGNIFVDPDSGKVTGIDNDAAFPEIDREEMLARSPKMREKAVFGMPQMMHQDTAAKILAASPDELRKQLQAVRPPNGDQGLSEESINGAVQRLKGMQAAIHRAQVGQGDMVIVAEFNEQTYQAAIQRQQSAGSASSAPRTSYIGSIEKERQSTLDYMKVPLSTYQMRSAKEVSKAKLNPEYVAYQKMDAAQQEQYRALQSELDQVEDQLVEVRQMMVKMEAPDGKSRSARQQADETRRQLILSEAGIVKELITRREQLHQMTGTNLDAAPQAKLEREEEAEGEVIDQGELAANMPAQFKTPKRRIAAKDVDAGEGLPRDRNKFSEEQIIAGIAKHLNPDNILPDGTTEYAGIADEIHKRMQPSNSLRHSADKAAIEARLIEQNEIQPLQQKIGTLEQELAELENTPGINPADTRLTACKSDLNEYYEDLDNWETRVETLKASMKVDDRKNRLAGLNAQLRREQNFQPREENKAEVGFGDAVKIHDGNPRQEYELQLSAAITAANLISRVPDHGITPETLKSLIGNAYSSAYSYEGPDRFDENHDRQRVKAANDRSINMPEKTRIAADMQPMIDQVNEIQKTVLALETAKQTLFDDFRSEFDAQPGKIQDPALSKAVVDSQAALPDAKKQVEHYQSRLDALKTPNLFEKAKANVQHGSVENARKHIQAKLEAAQNDQNATIQALNEALDSAARTATNGTLEGQALNENIAIQKADQNKLLREYETRKREQVAPLKPQRVQGDALELKNEPGEHHDVKSALKASAKPNDATLQNAANRAARNERLKPTVEESLHHHEAGHEVKPAEGSLRASWKSPKPDLKSSGGAPKMGAP